MSSTPDISKVISLIMQNPKLLEEISALANSEGGDGEAEASASSAAYEVESSPPPTYESANALPTPKKDRSLLINALRPYVSGERQRALDTMLTLSEVLDSMRRR